MRERIRNLSSRAEFFLIITLCFGYFIGSSLTVLLRHIHTFELSTFRVMRGIATEIAILAVTGWILHIRGWRLSRLSKRISWRGVLAGVPLVVAYFLLYLVTGIALVLAYPPASRLATMRMIPSAPAALLLVFIVVNSVFEEVTVSGYVVTALSEHGPALSITASTLLRFLYHLYQGPIACISILPLGLLFGAVYWRWKNLWPLGVAHTIANIVALVVAAHQAGA
ncbi:MAG TPA: CPBP family intramembrane glutamic endopeptidase [Thermoanaerobaculia bacterium]|nr:CPBP family intramembrane glutamic endopeptidase [Thermoanaerobaculia bacterium]